MSISRQTLTAVIVTFKSERVIHDCIKSIPKDIKIIIVDNSNDEKFKENLEKKYSNITCILSPRNLGMGAGNNLGLRNVKTDFAIILNPDVVLQEDTIEEIINSSKKIDSYSILAPLSINEKYPNYKVYKEHLANVENPFKVKSVDGFAMLLNLKRINQIESFKDFNYFDSNIFMYLENDDLCKRLNENNENIFIVPKSKIKHLGAKAVDQIYSHEIELSRNWHWIWSKFYFNKKHYGFFYACLKGLPGFLAAVLKLGIYSLINKKEKKEIYQKRTLGFIKAFQGKSSSYRPNIKI